MSKMLDVGIRITADGRVLVAQASAAKNALASLADTAKRGNNESAAATERFTSTLKRQADTLGMTASQVRAYDAAQLKLNETQRASVEASNRAIPVAAGASQYRVAVHTRESIIRPGVQHRIRPG